MKPGKANARAEVSRELASASLHKTGNGQPARVGEASIRAEVRSVARTGFPGVKGVSARGQNRRELGRPTVAAGGERPRQAETGNHNRPRRDAWESERPIVATKRLMPVERRGLGVSGADSEVRVG